MLVKGATAVFAANIFKTTVKTPLSDQILNGNYNKNQIQWEP